MKLRINLPVLVGLIGAIGLLGTGTLWMSTETTSDVTDQMASICNLFSHRAVAAEDKAYTCPMHDTIIENEPGECPICGMTLVEKKSPMAGDMDGASDSASSDSDSGTTAGGERKISHWVSPMDPTYISDGPGKSPMGMDLVPVYADKLPKSGNAKDIYIDPVVVQNMGVRIAPVQRGAISRKIRTIGEIDVAEDEISVINLRYSGWIEQIWADETGQLVKRGQKLFSIYSPELVSAQEEYLLAVNTSGAGSSLAKSAARRLELWDLPASHLKAIIRSGNAHRRMVITAPLSGYILRKTIFQGARVKAGSDLYRIGNLDRIWVNAEVYEFDAPWVKLGQRATMELSFQQGRQWEGKVSYIYPTLNMRSRTLTVRLEFPNPGIALKPGMFATVRIESQRKEDVLFIPTEAIIHSGERQIVFVTRGYGKYSAKNVVTGLVGDNHQTEVLSGLKADDTVVVSGQFLLDSESQLQEAVQKLLAARLQSKQKRAAGDDVPVEQDTSQATSYWTCSMHPGVVEDGPGTCPICGMNLVERKQ